MARHFTTITVLLVSFCSWPASADLDIALQQSLLDVQDMFVREMDAIGLFAKAGGRSHRGIAVRRQLQSNQGTMTPGMNKLTCYWNPQAGACAPSGADIAQIMAPLPPKLQSKLNLSMMGTMTAVMTCTSGKNQTSCPSPMCSYDNIKQECYPNIQLDMGDLLTDTQMASCGVMTKMMTEPPRCAQISSQAACTGECSWKTELKSTMSQSGQPVCASLPSCSWSFDPMSLLCPNVNISSIIPTCTANITSSIALAVNAAMTSWSTQNFSDANASTAAMMALVDQYRRAASSQLVSCVKASCPTVGLSFEASMNCSNVNAETPCNSDPTCAWDSVSLQCRVGLMGQMGLQMGMMFAMYANVGDSCPLKPTMQANASGGSCDGMTATSCKAATGCAFDSESSCNSVGAAPTTRESCRTASGMDSLRANFSAVDMLMDSIRTCAQQATCNIGAMGTGLPGISQGTVLPGTASAGVTTTMASSRAVAVSYKAAFSFGSPAAATSFASNTSNYRAVGDGIAAVIGVAQSWVTVTALTVSRRLEMHSSLSRRLQSTLTASFTVTIPAGTSSTVATPASIAANVDSVSSSASSRAVLANRIMQSTGASGIATSGIITVASPTTSMSLASAVTTSRTVMLTSSAMTLRLALSVIVPAALVNLME